MATQKTNRGTSKARTLFQHEPQTLRLFDYSHYRDYLAAVYQDIKKVYPSYSYSQFAEDLGFSYSNVVWLIINGRRKMSQKAADRILNHIKFTGPHRRYFLALMQHNNASQPQAREKYLQTLLEIKHEVLPDNDDQSRLEYFSEWYFPIIREMAGLSYFRSDPQWIAEQLYMKVRPKQVSHALTLLERLGLIQWDENKGRHIQTGGQIRPDRKVGTLAAIRFHEKMCELAREAVTRVPTHQRDLNALTIRLSSENAAKAAEILFEACRQIFELENAQASSQSSEERIYQLNMQLFSLMFAETSP
jgi:uncharacterized protein (TIGR02147 family)